MENTTHSSLENGLTIVIPAYNEEQAIESIIQRCLDARETIAQETQLEQIRVIVVDDGSRDRTYELASKYVPEITLLQHEKNKGYGAAIKYGFRVSNTTLVGFLDADGTCDPLFFSTLCNKQKEADADVVLGSRLGPQSEIPFVRRLGNNIYAFLLGTLSGQKIIDTASGMRVMKTESLPKLYPLPDGLHFTPAMSSRVLFHPELTLCEAPMPYAERIGESKLSVLQDGIRFLLVILEMALIYRPLLFFGSVSCLLFLACAVYAPGLIADAFRPGKVPDDRIYRMLALTAFFIGGLTLTGAGVLAHRIVYIFHNCVSTRTPLYQRLLKWLAPVGFLSLFAGIAININPLREYLTSGEITGYPWTYIAVGALLVLAGLQTLAVAAINFLLDLVIRHRRGEE